MVGERKFSEELYILLDDTYTKIINVESIKNKLGMINSIEELNNALNSYLIFKDNHDSVDETQFKEILEALFNRLTMLKNNPEEKTNNIIDVAKTNNPILNNLSVIRTDKMDNDKIDGLRNGVTYLEFNCNGNKVLFEVENEDNINKIFSNPNLNKMSEYEFLEVLRSYTKECTKIDMNNIPQEVPTQNYDEELRQVDSERIKEAMVENDNMFLKERVDFKNYVESYKQGQRISYALNSNGERIYIVGEEKYKFVGKDRELKKLSKEGKDENDMNVSNFNNDMKGKGNLDEINLDDFLYLQDYVGYEDLLRYIMEAMYYNIGISEKQNNFLARFLDLAERCKTDPTQIFPSGSLEYWYDNFLNTFGEEKKNNIISNNKGKKLKLTLKEKAGFISVAVILESALILGGIFAILALVKK